MQELGCGRGSAPQRELCDRGTHFKTKNLSCRASANWIVRECVVGRSCCVDLCCLGNSDPSRADSSQRSGLAITLTMDSGMTVSETHRDSNRPSHFRDCNDNYKR